MNRIMKRSFATAVGTALLALSASAAAGDLVAKPSAVKLSDADLDQITAGSGARTEVLIFNPGQAEVLKANGRPGAALPSHGTCINCMELDAPRTSGFVVIIFPSGEFMTKTVRQAPF